jgi:tetratricopeptide (TPR) repeat protein
MRPGRNLAAAVLLLSAASAGCDREMYSQIQNGEVGRDPHAFRTAREMYSSPPSIPLTAKGRELLGKLTAQVQSNPGCAQSAEADDWWLGLAALNKHRGSREVQEAVSAWADRCAAHAQRTAGGAAADNLLQTANAAYSQRKFGTASQQYSQLLVRCPLHLDARNNLALAQLHKGNDLIAQLHWEILCRLSGSYVPARINLTVLYERLGQRDKARAMADEALRLNAEVPASVFNAAWLQDLSGDPPAAEKQLRSFAHMNACTTLVSFRTLILKEMGVERPPDEEGFWRRGVAGVCGGRTTKVGFVAAFLVFAMTVVLVGWGLCQACKGADTPKVTAFWSFCIVGGLWYLLFWGAPYGGWWLAPVVFLIVGGAATAMITED